MEKLTMDLNYYGFLKMFGDLLEWATDQQKNDIFEYLEELSHCVDELDEMTVRDIIRFDMNVDSHEDIIYIYDCVKDYMNDNSCDLYEALSYYTTIYSYNDDEVVYVPF